MAKPADFYVGVLDVFSILLPGAIVSWITWVWLGGAAGLGGVIPQDGIGAWVAFVLAAYAAGHIVFMLASLVDNTFNAFRHRVLPLILSQKRVSNAEAAYEAAEALCLTVLSAGAVQDRVSVADNAKAWARSLVLNTGEVAVVAEPANPYKWSRAVLRLRNPTALVEVQRMEADSKFFRSLFVVFVFLTLCLWVHLPGLEKLPLSYGILLFLAALSYWRYAERRYAALEEAYVSAIVLFTADAAALRARMPSDASLASASDDGIAGADWGRERPAPGPASENVATFGPARSSHRIALNFRRRSVMVVLSCAPGAGERGSMPPPKAQPAPGNAQAQGTAPG